MNMHTGSCECGDVTFEISGELRPVTACHCRECRKTSGHYGASTYAATDQMTITRGRSLAWFQSTDRVRKGFCRRCGASLFWRLAGRDGLSVSAGAFDTDLPVRLAKHVFVSEKANYYDITAGLPQAEGFDLDAMEVG